MFFKRIKGKRKGTKRQIFETFAFAGAQKLASLPTLQATLFWLFAGVFGLLHPNSLENIVSQFSIKNESLSGESSIFCMK